MSVRFAPSPTGIFHIGNLRTAWISHQWAKKLKQDWVVRFEDIDTPRVLKGSQENQLADMKALGLMPDKIYLQSEKRARHWDLFLKVIADGKAYPCICTRRELQQTIASAPHSETPLYSGHCRELHLVESENPTVSWRFKNTLEDGSQDFIIARTGSLEPKESEYVPSYHWACAIDDIDGAYELLVRAWDLESSAKLQRAIQNWLLKFENKKIPLPAIFHTALIVQDDGHRLEKRTKGVTLDQLSGVDILKCFSDSFNVNNYSMNESSLFGESEKQICLKNLNCLKK